MLNSSRILTKEIQGIIDKLRNSKYCPATKRNYQCVWKAFNNFFVRLDDKPTDWEDRIVLFVGYLIDCKKQSSTIRSYLSAIRAVLLDNDISLSQNEYLLASLTKACKLVNDKVRHHFPIGKGLLMLLLNQVEQHFSQRPYVSILYKTLFRTAYFGLFRVGELTNTFSNHAVLAKDVHIGTNKKKFMFVLHSSKTHGPASKPQKIKISSTPVGVQGQQSVSKYCPYELLHTFLTMRGGYRSCEEQFFIFRDFLPVQANHMRKILKLLLNKAGFDSTLYDTHSFSLGRSLDLLKCGLSIETVKEIGRWRSNAVFTYLKS